MAIIFIRTLIVFLVMIVAMRIMGKRQLGELEPIELVITVLISNLASQPLQEIGTPLLYGLVPVLTLLACQVLISGITMRSPKMRCIISGKPSILVKNGKIDQAEMRKNRITPDELAVELRREGITDIKTVKYAILETGGSVSVLPYAAHAPVVPEDINLSVTDDGLPVTVISDGRIIRDNLRVCGVDERWLEKQLSSRKVKSHRDVYLLTVDGEKNVYFLPKEAKK